MIKLIILIDIILFQFLFFAVAFHALLCFKNSACPISDYNHSEIGQGVNGSQVQQRNGLR